MNGHDVATGLYVVTTALGETYGAWGPDEEGDFRKLNDPNGGYHRSGITDARPLVVLDPESDEDTERFRSAILDYGNGGTARHILRALAAPTPAEPMGLGAVVRDNGGRIWLRTPPTSMGDVFLWMETAGDFAAWIDIDSPEVLSEGWPE